MPACVALLRGIDIGGGNKITARQERARIGSASAAGGALPFRSAGGAGTSNLMPALSDRLVGSPTTAGNWRTVLKLREMFGRP